MATLLGSAGDDLLVGGPDNDLLLALSGADTLDGGDGRDRASLDRSAATTGLRFAALSPGFVTLLAGPGGTLRATGIEDFTLVTGSGNDRLTGGAGDDSLTAGDGADALAGGAGADTLDGGAGGDTLLGGGLDLLVGGDGADRFVLADVGRPQVGSTLGAPLRIADFDAAAGDRLALRGNVVAGAVEPLATRSFALDEEDPRPVAFAGALAPGTPLEGLALPDPTGGAAVLAHWLPDAVAGGWLLLDVDRDGLLGIDDLVARIDLPAGAAIGAADFLPGSFALVGTGGDDILSGTAQADALHGLAGADSIAAGDAADAVLGGAGDDRLLGEGGSDTLEGQDGADTLLGGAELDVLQGGDGEDRLAGEDGDDLLRGGSGSDLLEGGSGRDRLEGGAGSDTLWGGAGADTFVLVARGETEWPTLHAPDALEDFDPGDGDRLAVEGLGMPILFTGTLGTGLAALSAGLRLPNQRWPGVAALEAFWVPALDGGAPAGGWFVVDADRDGLLGARDAVARVGSVANPVAFARDHLAPGTALRFATASAPVGTDADDTLTGGWLAELFLGTEGSDTIEAGAGAGNGLSYAGLTTGAIAVEFLNARLARISKESGGFDLARDVQSFIGTAGDDTLDGGNAGTGLYTVSLEGRAGTDLIVGDLGPDVQVSYAGSPAAVLVNLSLGRAEDGWGSTDILAGIRRVAVTSAFHDEVAGSAANDTVLSGADGNKTIDGRFGTDIWRYAGPGAVRATLVQGAAYKPGGIDRLTNMEGLYGADGDDSLTGTTTEDRLAGGPGDDTLAGGSAFDTLDLGHFTAASGLPRVGAVANLQTGLGTDPWGGSDRFTGFEHAWGSSLGDDITGFTPGLNPSWLRGLAGDDTLRAAAPAILVGTDHSADPIGVTVHLGQGTGADGFGGIDTFVGLRAARGTAFADRLTGTADADLLLGGDGDDTLDGGLGADRLTGGTGNDRYVLDSDADTITELPGGGIDTVVVSFSHALRAEFERLVLTGDGATTGLGNALDNQIVGDAGTNRLIGNAGNDTLLGNGRGDTLYGMDGDDSLDGGFGPDFLYGDVGDDTLLGGVGNDSLHGEDGYDALFGGAGLDRLAGGEGGDLLFGEDDNDLLLGQGGPDSLYGGGARDQLQGGEGSDSLDGGDELDLLYGEDGHDLLLGGDGDDWLFAAQGNDTLEGGAGFDRMFGGFGDDLYRITDGFDLALEGLGEGRDTVEAAVPGGGFTLTGEVEVLVLLPGTVWGNGSPIGNLLLGNAGANSLFGWSGDDTLVGSAGNDVLWGQLGRDTFVFAPGDGRDSVADFRPGEDRLDLSAYGLSGWDAFMASVSTAGPSVVVTLGSDRFVLFGVSPAGLSAADILL